MTDHESLEQSRQDQQFRRKALEENTFRKRMLALQKKTLRGGGNLPKLKSFRKSAKQRRGACATQGQGSWQKLGLTPPFILKVHGTAGIIADAYAERQEGSEFLDSNMLGLTASERSEEFAIDAARHPTSDPKNLFIHFSLSRPQGENLPPDVWQKVVRQFLNRIGAHGCNFVATRHTKTDNDHVHVLMSRVLPISRKLLSKSHNFWKWREALRSVESDLGITAADRPIHAEKPLTPGSDRMVNAQRRSARLNHPSPFIDPHFIDQALSTATSFEQFAHNLNTVGIKVMVAEKNDKVCGVLFQKSGCEQALAGSSIDRKFSLPRIQAKLETNHQLLLKTEQDQLIQRIKMAQQQNDHERHGQYSRDV